MPYKRQSSTSKPLSKAARTQTSANGIPQGLFSPLHPPLEPGQESVMDVMREVVKRKYPNFVPRSSVDILVMSGPGYDGPTTQESICAYIDMSSFLHIAGQPAPNVEDLTVSGSYKIDTTLGRTPAANIIGLHPRPGQNVCVRVMPPWPEYSIRLWASSPGLRLFGMDFLESATGAPVNLSDRFHMYGADVLGAYEPIPPFDLAPVMEISPPSNPETQTELYTLREEQTIVIQDMLEQAQAEGTVVRFHVPRHPVNITKPTPGFKYCDLDFSLGD